MSYKFIFRALGRPLRRNYQKCNKKIFILKLIQIFITNQILTFEKIKIDDYWNEVHAVTSK
jgi:hypothetical protein